MGITSMPPPVPPRTEEEKAAARRYYERLSTQTTPMHREPASFGAGLGFILGWLIGSSD